MILKGRVQKDVPAAGVFVKTALKSSADGVHFSPLVAVALGLATPKGKGEYPFYEGVEQDVEIEVRRVDKQMA